MDLLITNAFYVLLLSIFAITFIESGLDKVFNLKGNLAWFQSQFEKSFIKPFVTPLFYWITIQEVVLGLCFILSIIGMLTGSFHIEIYSCIAGLFLLIQLFTGQRIAKDYAGASGILPYIILMIITIFLFQF